MPTLIPWTPVDPSPLGGVLAAALEDMVASGDRFLLVANVHSIVPMPPKFFGEFGSDVSRASPIEFQRPRIIREQNPVQLNRTSSVFRPLDVINAHRRSGAGGRIHFATRTAGQT